MDRHRVSLSRGVLGMAAVLMIESILPYALAFGASAMIYVVVEEVITESQAAVRLVLDFALMLLLDVGLG